MRALGKSELWNVQLILALWIGFFCMLSEERMLVSLISFLEKLRLNIFVEIRWHGPRPPHDQTVDIIRKQGGYDHLRSCFSTSNGELKSV